jgi:hypothetical protein
VAKRRVQGNRRNREWSRMFFDAAKRPTDWLRVARKLRSCADAIFEREKPIAAKALDELQRLLAEGKPEELDIKGYAAPNLDAGYMLMAFAIENLLKGLIVGKGTVDATNPNRLFDELFTNNLVDLHDLASERGCCRSGLRYH